jgi:hypothetical protein
MWAEAAAKASFILGSAGLEWIKHPDFAALFILDDGEMVYSQRWKNI